MKALVVAPQPFFSPRGTPLSVYYRTLVAAEFGIDIDLLTYGQGQDVDIPGVRIIRIPQFAPLGKVKVGPSILKLFLDAVLIVWTVGLLLRHRYDLVHAHEEAIFFCRFLKPIFGFKLIYDMHSCLPQQLTNFQFTTSQLLIRLFKKLEESSIQKADAIITICPDLSEYAIRLSDDKKKCFLIENSLFDLVNMPSKSSEPRLNASPACFEDKLPRLPQNKRFVVYTGTLAPYQGIDILIGAMSRVVAQSRDTVLIVVGGDEGLVRHYSALAEKNGLAGYVHFTGYVSQALAKECCRLASVFVSPRKVGMNTPLKLYGQLGSGIPLVATNIRAHTQILDSDVAFLVEPEVEDMARGILAALEPNGNRDHIAENARRLYEKKYSRSVYVGKMRNLLEFLS